MNLTGLTHNTEYYVRAYAINSQGTTYGETKQFTTKPSPPGNCLDFDGADDYVEIADSPDLDLTTAMTVETWVRFDALPVN